MKRFPKDHFLEVSLTGNVRNTQLQQQAKRFLIQQGFEPGEIVEFKDWRHFRYAVYVGSPRNTAKVRKNFYRLALPDIHLQQNLLKPKAWKEKWKTDYKIQPLASRLMLVPLWKKKLYRQSQNIMPLFLDPKSVFGAGTHETTRMMARMISKLRGQFKTFLDLGTGTGILAAVAWRMGAETIMGLDREKEAVRTAAENLKHNGCAGAIFFNKDLARFKPGRKFDLVGANLSTETLIRHRNRIFSFVKPKKYLLVSGILRSHLKEIENSYHSRNFRLLKIVKEGKWACLLYRKGK